MRRKVAGNVMWMLLERGLQVASGIGVAAMLARALGTQGFAQFQYAQAVVFLAASAALICGAEVVIPRLVADSAPARQHSLLCHAFWMRLAAAAAGYLAMLGFLLLSGQASETWVPAAILGVSILLREPFGIVSAWMQSRTWTRPSTLFNVASLASKLLCVALLFHQGIRSVPAYACAFALESVVLAALLGGYYSAQAERPPFAYRRAQWLDLMRDGTLFWVGMALMMAARRIDQLLLKPAIPLAELGAYAASMQVLDNFILLATILAAGIAPAYVYNQPTAEAAHRNIGRIACALGAIGFGGAAVIALLAGPIVHLLYGAAFDLAAQLLRLAALASSLIFVDVGLTLLQVHLRRPRLVAVKWGLLFGTTLLVDYLAIPHWGARGAILGYAAANALAVAFSLTLWLRAGARARRLSSAPTP